MHQLIVPPLGRLVGEGHVAVAAEVLPHVPLHVVPVSVNLLHGDVGEELAALVALLVVLSNWQFNWIRIIPLNWFKKSAEKLQKGTQMVSMQLNFLPAAGPLLQQLLHTLWHDHHLGVLLVLVEEVVAARDVDAAVAPRVEQQPHPQVAVLLLPLLRHVDRPQGVAQAPLLPHEEREAVEVLGPEVGLEDDLVPVLPDGKI